MHRRLASSIFTLCGLALSGWALSSCAATPPAADLIQPIAGDYVMPQPLLLTARTLRAWSAEEADQGVAVDAGHFYAVDNSTLAKYETATGKLVARWSGPSHGLIRHLNSCFADRGRLWCANSNYSLTPMGSSVEVFDTSTLAPVDSHSLGMTDEGSLTWFDRYAGASGNGWIASFAHYTGDGEVKFKDHTFSSVVTFDAQWRRTGGWLFPQAVVERMAPDAASGGAIGPDGLLYILGHDRPEMYVLARPSMGPTLIHVATINVEAEGQAFSWSRDGNRGGGRSIFAINRRGHRVLEIALPEVSLAAFPDARTFRR
jgi:hypothetical protein